MSLIESTRLRPVLEFLLKVGLTLEDMEAFIASKRSPPDPVLPMWEWMDGEGSGKIRVFLDAPMNLPFDGAKPDWKWGRQSGIVEVERRAEGVYVAGKKFRLHREPEQRPGSSIGGYYLQRHLEHFQGVQLHPNVLDSMAEAGLIPDECKADGAGRTLYLIAWADGFSDVSGHLYVRGVFWPGGGPWIRRYFSLDRDWDAYSPAAVAS